MSSFFSSGIIPLLPDQSSPAFAEAEEELGYPFKIPKVFLEGETEKYYPQVNFSWADDTVVVLRDNRLITYTKSEFTELLAEDENGNVIWMDGRSAPYAGTWPDRYLNKTRAARAYKIVEYDLETSEKRTYKVSLEETTQFNDRDLSKVAAFADTEGLGMAFRIKGGVLEKYNGASADVEIPEGVTKIDWYAFSKKDTYESIRIPKTVVDIAPGIFDQKTIAHIEVDPENPRYYCRDGLLIDKRTKTVILGYAGNKIPGDGSVTKIGSSAFYGRTDLKYMEIPDSVTKIGDNAFAGCSNLEKVMIADSVTAIERHAFYECACLTEIKLSASLTQISYGLFRGCEKLKSVTIPESVTVIDSDAFNGCCALEKIILPETVSQIEDSAFQSCAALTEITLPTSTTEIPSWAFANCSKLRRITIPDSVLQIGSHAFFGCSILEEVRIPDSVFKIGCRAFQDCENLVSIRLPEDIVEISSDLFDGCKRLKNIVIPDAVRRIGEGAFMFCSALTDIVIPTAVRKIDNCAFAHAGLSSLHIPDSVKLIGDKAFTDCYALEQVNIPVRHIPFGKRIFGRELRRQGDSTICFLAPKEDNDESLEEFQELPF